MKLTHYDPEYVSEPHPDDERLIGAAFSLGIRLLLALAARPEYLDAAAGGSRSPGKGGNEWTPVRWAGRGHRHTVASGDDSRGEGVRLHWRRGHFRNQPYGEGRALRKIIWLEPVLVGGDGK